MQHDEKKSSVQMTSAMENHAPDLSDMYCPRCGGNFELIGTDYHCIGSQEVRACGHIVPVSSE